MEEELHCRDNFQVGKEKGIPAVAQAESPSGFPIPTAPCLRGHHLSVIPLHLIVEGGSPGEEKGLSKTRHTV